MKIPEIYCWVWWKLKREKKYFYYTEQKEIDETIVRIFAKYPKSLIYMSLKTMEEFKLIKRIDRYKFEVLENNYANHLIRNNVSPWLL